ncbi:hypothetical protein PENTCL1PPCAC_22993, partial [Pristionchus entomophagus]
AVAEYSNETMTIERDSNMYEGIIKDDNQSQVFGSIHDGIFEGMITLSNGEEFWIESSFPYNASVPFHSFIYSTDEIEMPESTERMMR